jgi:hypothetical protein
VKTIKVNKCQAILYIAKRKLRRANNSFLLQFMYESQALRTLHASLTFSPVGRRISKLFINTTHDAHLLLAQLAVSCRRA